MHFHSELYSFFIENEELYSYTNYAMETPTPSGAPGDCIQGLFHQIDSLSPGQDSDFDESLAVPESLSVIDADKVDHKDATNVCTATLPFKTVHEPPIKFNSIHRKVFIPGVEIKVKFTENERSVTTHLLNPNLYTILLQHGDFTWSIKKRYKHILYLHQQLTMYRTSLNIPFPTKTHKSRRASLKNTVQDEEKAERIAFEALPRSNSQKKKETRPRKRKAALPRFPRKPEVMVSYDGIQLRMKQLEEYMFNLLNISIYRNHFETVKFLEVSNLSFISDLGGKGKEGMILKRTGSTQPGQAGCNCFGVLGNMVCVRCNYCCTALVCAKWQERWLFVKDSCFGYVRPRDGVVKAVMLFDQGFEVSSGMYSTGMSHGLQILNQSRQMVIKCWTKRKSKEWMQYLKTVANQTARDFTCPNVHQSFCPPRSSTGVRMMVDGADYLSAAADAMELATEEIFIADWWLSPEIYLKRPALHGNYWRLDILLKRKAAQGVKIFILLYKEVEMAIGINSFYSKSRLVADNIKVFRHPDHARAGVLLWAHHEKIVCVDQTVAFLGGIDLCYGRWDDHKHRLTDLGNISQPKTSFKTKKKTSSSPGGGLWFPHNNGLEAALELARSSKDIVVGFNDATSNFSESEETQEESSTEKESNDPKPNLPVLEPGDALLIASTHQNGDVTDSPDIQKRNVLNKITDRGKDIISIIYPPYEEERNEQKFDDSERKKAEKYALSNDQILLSDALGLKPNVSRMVSQPTPLAKVVEGRVITKSTKEKLEGIEGNSKLWIGKDYCNFIVKDFNNLDLPFVDLVDRNTTPRMPWHDVGCAVRGAAARDVARHFVQRWNAIKLEKARQNTNYPYLLPKTYTDIKPLEGLDRFLDLKSDTVTCQVLRSVSSWSCGFLEPDTLEQSVHEAYVDTITRAQHYVYIENQFFITLSRSSQTVRNQIGEALYNRIMRAHRASETFRVYVVMPLLPAFEGEVGAPSGTSLHAVTHWNYQSICRSRESIIHRLYESGVPDPSQYITFHGLRTHSVLEGEPITELVYVHSKLLIADDKIIICGSANINDRSLIGKRDSEIAVWLQDEKFDEGILCGQPFPCGKVAGALRKRLFREHLGLLDHDPTRLGVNIDDICSDHFYRNIWKETSRRNTEVYEEVFHTIPTDAVHTFAELKKYQEEHPRTLWYSDPALANRKIDLIQGHVVDMPLEFLCNEVLTPRNTSMEGMMPTSLWT